MNSVSLFCSSGIGDLAMRKNGIDTVIANELVTERAQLFKENFPEATVVKGDIWEKKNHIVQLYKEKFKDEELFMISATPPCQGMSLAGMGKMISDFRNGKRPNLNPKFDERNRLIIPAVDIMKQLYPRWIVMENVENMRNTLIYDENDDLVTIIDYIFKELEPLGYVGKAEVINVADYGVPQSRKRLITILTRDKTGAEWFKKNNSFLPKPTNSEQRDLFSEQYLTVRDVIGKFPPLDAKTGMNSCPDFHPLHKVPVLNQDKYFWIEHTPEGESAFNNQCINTECLYQNNQRHGSKKDKNSGITQSLKETPLYCEKCGSILPRPWTVDKKTGNKRIMKGYISAFKRMYWDKPASTITTRFQFAGSDHNIHPDQNRVLSLYEAICLQTIDKYDFKFKINNKIVSDSLIRDTIGESIPPMAIDKIVENILTMNDVEQIYK